MIFDYDLNQLIPYEITKYNTDLRIIPQHGDEIVPQLNRDLKTKLGHVIDRIGEASSKAQGLKEIITSYRKFSLSNNHRIYLMKAVNSENKTCLVGLLKVGEKKLFIYDNQGQNHEMTPLCVLDFYVHESQQRRGFGRKLFDYMLESEQVKPEHLAIDSPSEKSVRFLKKHYDLRNPVTQTNNYMVFGGFFDNRLSLLKRNGHIRHKYDTSYSANPYYNYKNDLPPLNGDQQSKALLRTGSVDARIYRNDHYSNNNNANTNGFKSSQSTGQDLNNNLKQSGGSLGDNLANSAVGSKAPSAVDSHSATANADRSSDIHKASTLADMRPDLYATRPPTNTTLNKSNTMYDYLNQAKLYNFYEKNFSNKYDPFPSLNPFMNPNYRAQLAAAASASPQMPSLNKQQTNMATNSGFYLPSDANKTAPSAPVNVYNRPMYNPYDAFPSLTAVKTAPDLYANQFYANSKFRKTKLW